MKQIKEEKRHCYICGKLSSNPDEHLLCFLTLPAKIEGKYVIKEKLKGEDEPFKVKGNGFKVSSEIRELDNKDTSELEIGAESIKVKSTSINEAESFKVKRNEVKVQSEIFTVDDQDINEPKQELETEDKLTKVSTIERNISKIKIETMDGDKNELEIEGDMEDHKQTNFAGKPQRKSLIKKPFPCNICNYSFVKKGNLDVHMQKHLDSKVFSCDQCDKTYTENGHLRRHKVEKHGFVFNNECNFCGKHFRYPADLETHERIHLGIKPFACDKCDQRFVDKGKLKYHTRQKHGNLDFVCVECAMGFKFIAHLNNHKRIHTGEKPYFCETCGKYFRDNTVFRNHKKFHITGLRFECTEPGCEKIFSQEFYLKRHIKRHNATDFDRKQFMCEYCFKSFTEAGNLRTHIKIHSGERPFMCDVCSKTFGRKGNHDVHKRIHDNEKQYICDQCEMGFNEKIGLQRHKTKRHGNDSLEKSVTKFETKNISL